MSGMADPPGPKPSIVDADGQTAPPPRAAQVPCDSPGAPSEIAPSGGRLLQILDSLAAYVAFIDTRQRFSFVNRFFEENFGLPRGQILGRHLSDLLGKAAYDEIRPHAEKALAGQIASHETLLRLPGGRERWHNARMLPQLDDRGAVEGFVVFVHDVTLRRQAEEALRESEARARERLAEIEHLYATAPVGLALHGPDMRILRINQRLAAMDGLSVADHIGRSLGELLPDVAAAVEPIVQRVIASRQPVLDQELHVSTPARPTLVGLASFCPLTSESGEVLAVSVSVQDITEVKRTQQALRESEERLSRILESAMDAIVTLDRRRVIQLFNAAAEEMFRCPAAEAIGGSFDRFAPAALRRLLARYMRTLPGPGASRRYLWAPEGLQAVRQGGEAFPVEATISRAEAGGQPLYTIILRDVNERKQAQDELRKLQAENVYLRSEIQAGLDSDEIVGTSPAIRHLLTRIEQVAATGSTVLVTGETGTGKELVAKAVHRRSQRRDRLLVAVNCAALPGSLIESELFGHEKGAFTGATVRKIGRFEMADGGTLFLDEVGDLPLELQAKLLRVLQEGELERLGGSQTIRVDVRVIAATNRDLNEAVAIQRFRSDLYYRLNVFPIQIPPLRERPEDIPVLARHFVMKHATNMGKRIESIPGPTMKALQAYGWPGNVRELQNVLERAVIISPGPVLELGEWPAAPRLSEPEDHVLTLEELQREHILRALNRAGWRITGEHGAAKSLGLKATTLHARMKKLGIRRPN